MLDFLKKYINPVQLTHTYDTSSIESKTIILKQPTPNHKLAFTKNSLPFQFGFLQSDTTQFHTIFALNNILFQGSIDKERNIQLLVQNQIKNISTKLQSIVNGSEIYTLLEVQLANKYNNIVFKNVNNCNSPVDVVNIMQSINKNLSVGIEFLKFGKHFSCGYVLRMMNKNNIITVGKNSGGVSVNVHRKINNFFSLASETILNKAMLNQCLGLRLSTKKADVNVELDNMAKMRITIENKMFEGCNFTVSSEMDVLTGAQKCGIGLSLDK